MRQDNAIDSNPLFRYLHLHCFIHMFRVLGRNSPKEYISTPRFKLFKRIERLYHYKEQYNLFKNLIFTFLGEVIMGIVITIIASSLNLLVPELIRQFMHFMKEKHLEDKQYGNFIYVFIVIQFLRIFFTAHSKRLFHELAIKVESTLARKLISKSLRMTKECRDRIPDSELIQLQNVDLKLIFTLFRNMFIIFQAPFTIIVAIILLFNESSHYGFIGIYWFLIAFLLQRQLDGRMTHCNTTKLKLIQQRSNLNYHLLDKFKGAKLIGWEDIIVEKNNDLFIEQNHDHDIFYSYMTYYDITLLMLPIFVVATITLFDSNQDDPITVQQVYLMLSLLGICYNPMKSMRMISINMHDGLHSLRRLSKYFHFPESTKSGLIEKKGRTGQIIIFEGTEAMHPHSSSDFNVHITEEVVVQPGERLILLGKKHSGRSSFLQMLVGNMKRVKGKISITGKISFCPQKPFLMKDTVKENIRFFNQNLSDLQIEEIYNQLGLFQELSFETNLNTVMDDRSKFTKATLKKIAIARCLCAEADIYILNNPFTQIDEQYITVIEKKLRELQDLNKTVVLSLTRLAIIDPEDQIVILEDGEIAEYDYFDVLVNSTESQIRNYFELKQDDIDEELQPQTARKILGNFTKRVESAIKYDLKSATLQTGRRMIPRRSTTTTHSPLQMLSKRDFDAAPVTKGFEAYVIRFMTSVSLRESIFIFFIILAAEVLHIFIHFYIGHLEEENAKDDYTKYNNLMITEVILTFCLAGLIYLQGQFSTLLAIIIGNRIYKESFQSLTSKSIVWYNNQYNVKLADRYNHDYEEIYIACHSIFGIYKNLVILIATIQFISTNRSKLMAIFVVLAAIYYSIFIIFRKIQRKIVKHFFDYKYNFVRCLEESIQGAELMNICEVKKAFMERAEVKYLELASYKLSASYTTYGLSLVCDILSMSLLVIGIEYGIEMKAHHHNQSISIIATSIFLLMNISEVLKTIIWEMLNFETFFNINIVPFLEIRHMSGYEDFEQQMPVESLPHLIRFSGHILEFKNMYLQEQTQKTKNFEPLNFVIPEGQIVLLYEKNHRYRDILLMAITKNLASQHTLKRKSSNILLGGLSIKDVPRVEWLEHFGLIMEENFFFIGTIKQNISWRLPHYDHQQAKHYAKQLKLYKDYPMLSTSILDAKLKPEHRSTSSLIKKIALLRIFLRKPDVVIMKDMEEFIDGVYVTEMLKQQMPNVTIIKISRSIQQSFDVDRIIALEKLELQEEGAPEELKQNIMSKVGKELKEINLKSYAFSKKVSKKMKARAFDTL